MPKIMCHAITCIHNCGNLDGKCPQMGVFECRASKIEFACIDIEAKCPECGYAFSLEQRMDCKTYKRKVGEEIV